MQINTWPRKLIVITLTLAACGFMLYRIYGPWRAAWLTRHKIYDPAIYERAIRLDPNNADYHFILAQIYNYSTAHLNVERAREAYEAATRLNPYRAAHWLELSKFYEQEGNTERARSSMEVALKMDPHYAQTHWAAANLYIRLNDMPAADFELRRTADLDVAYLSQVLDLVWRFYGEPQKIITIHVPNTKEANLTALNFFISKNTEQGASMAWDRLRAFSVTPQDLFPYIEYLVNLGQPHPAWDVFLLRASASPRLNFFNSSFETEPLNGGFDWRLSSWERAQARRDTTQAKDGMASLLVTFDGKENLDYAHVWHWLPVEKGKSYNLSFWLKTEAISTDQGIFVEVDGQASPQRIGTNYWEEFTIPFTASSDLVTVRVRRLPTRKFDNLLKGKVWLDGFSIQ